jgi:hypothetical protein
MGNWKSWIKNNNLIILWICMNTLWIFEVQIHGVPQTVFDIHVCRLYILNYLYLHNFKIGLGYSVGNGCLYLIFCKQCLAKSSPVSSKRTHQDHYHVHCHLRSTKANKQKHSGKSLYTPQSAHIPSPLLEKLHSILKTLTHQNRKTTHALQPNHNTSNPPQQPIVYFLRYNYLHRNAHKTTLREQP